jgi:glycosyltransferase involved in cell wall biosynthesis
VRVCVVGGIFDRSPAYREQHPLTPETQLVAGLQRAGVEVTALGHFSFGSPAGYDIVHVHHLSWGALRMAAARGDTRFVLTPHDGFLFADHPMRLRKRLSTRPLLRAADTVVALSDRERLALLKRYGLRPGNVRVIPNGVDNSIFHAPEHPPSAEDFILYAGQLERFKGLDYLFEALPAIRKRFSSTKLVLAYHTAAELPHYRSLAARLGIEDAVVFAGPKTPAQLAELYARAAVFVQPSLVEALSGVVLEAMACGAAIVATDVGGIRTQLDENTGIVVRPRDPAALGQAVCRLLADSGLRARMGSAAAAKARRQFGIKTMVDSHLRLYDGLLREKPSRSTVRRVMLAAVGKLYLDQQRTGA